MPLTCDMTSLFQNHLCYSVIYDCVIMTCDCVMCHVTVIYDVPLTLNPKSENKNK